MGDTLGLTHCSLPTMEADRPTTEGTSSEATGCTPTWRTGPRSAVASSPTASAGAPPAASTRSTGRPSRRSSTTPSRPATAAPSRKRPSILDPLLPVVHQILEDDRKAPRKQRHTAKRIFERLRAEHGYPGGLTIVKDAVRAWRRRTAEVFVPLAHPPGEAQADFGQAEVTLDGQAAKVAVFVMTLPYSDAIFACAFPRECTEAFLEGHVRAFAFFGGVPRRISYDNSKIAVAKITGTRDRKLTDEFLRLKSHHLFEDHFCLVRRPNEKGHVETLVGFARRNFLVPVPAAHGGLEGLNARLEADCRDDLARRLRGKPATKAELLAEERAAMLPLPAEAFLAARVEQPTADSLSLVRFDTNDYSVPTAYAHHKLTAVGTVDTVRIVAGDRVVAEHRRCWGRERVIYDPVHYLALLERKPGALDFAGPAGRAGSCRSASACSAAGSRPSSAGRGRGGSSRSCGCWSGRARGT